jgi:O-antigen/teichoic acid export membrane protein
MFDLGLGRATIHRIAELRDAEPAARLATFHTAVAVNVAIGVVGGLVLALGASLFFAWPQDRAGASWRVVGCGAAAWPVAADCHADGVLTGALQGRERFAQTNAVRILSTILFQVVPLAIAWHWGPNVSVLLLAGMATRIATLVVLWIACNREFGWNGRFQFERDQVRILLGFGGWVTVTALISPVLTIVDRFAIGSVIGAAAVTFYSVPYQVTQRIVILPTALTNALFPAERHAVGRVSALSRESMLILIALMTGPVVFAILLTGPALALWLGQALRHARHCPPNCSWRRSGSTDWRCYPSRSFRPAVAPVRSQPSWPPSSFPISCRSISACASSDWSVALAPSCSAALSIMCCCPSMQTGKHCRYGAP